MTTPNDAKLDREALKEAVDELTEWANHADTNPRFVRRTAARDAVQKALEANERLEAELAEAREVFSLTVQMQAKVRDEIQRERDSAREQRDKLAKALRKVDGMVVSSFDGPRGGPAHQIHAEIQSTLAALKEEKG